jgi:hypothetical protein
MQWPDGRFEEGAVVVKEHKAVRKTGRPRIIPFVIKLLLWKRSVQEDAAASRQSCFPTPKPTRHFRSHPASTSRCVVYPPQPLPLNLGLLEW